MGRKVNVFSGATIPQPLVQELPQDAAWDEWSKAVEQHEAKFAPTAPASLPMRLGEDARYDATPEPTTLEEMDARDAARAQAAAAKAATAVPAAGARPAGQLSLDELLQSLRKENRVCPHQSQWTKLYVLLAQHRKGTTRLPPPPLTGKAWDATPVMAKRLSFHAHLEWASMHGCLPEVNDFLKALPPDAWYCG